MSFLIPLGRNAKEICNLEVRCAFAPVQSFPNWAEAHIGSENGDGAGECRSVQPVTGERSNRRGAPQRCGCI